MRRVRRGALLGIIRLQRRVDGREAAVVPDLKDAARCRCAAVEHGARIVELVAIGFSQKTCRPARAAAAASSVCFVFGVVT